MHAKNIRALNDLCEEHRAVAKCHFEAYVRETSHLDENKDENTSLQNTTHRKGKSPLTYAQVVSSKNYQSQQASINLLVEKD